MTKINKTYNFNYITEILRILYYLQLIDSRRDEIKEFRDNMPEEINDILNEITLIENDIKKINMEISSIKKNIDNHRKNIKHYNLIINKYKNKKNTITNNKDLYKIDKEIDYKNLEIQLSKKKIKSCNNILKKVKYTICNKNIKLKKIKENLCFKKKELNNILLKNTHEEKILIKQFLTFSIKLDKKILETYQKIRKRVNNGIAVAPVKKGAAVGTYLSITPQKHSELTQRNKIIIDEHSGRILIDDKLAEEEKKIFHTDIKKKL